MLFRSANGSIRLEIGLDAGLVGLAGILVGGGLVAAPQFFFWQFPRNFPHVFPQFFAIVSRHFSHFSPTIFRNWIGGSLTTIPPPPPCPSPPAVVQIGQRSPNKGDVLGPGPGQAVLCQQRPLCAPLPRALCSPTTPSPCSRGPSTSSSTPTATQRWTSSSMSSRTSPGRRSGASKATSSTWSSTWRSCSRGRATKSCRRWSCSARGYRG